MELLCPNCQKKLTVPEQYAGQMMRCPLCNGTFTVPALPAGGEGGVSFGSFSAGQPPKAETYQVAPEPAAAAPQVTLEPEVAPQDVEAPPPPPPTGYAHTHTAWLSPKVVPWVAVGALLLVFVLYLFFPWVGLYPGGVGGFTQSGLWAAFGTYSTDKVWEKMIDFKKDEWRPGVDVLMIFYLLVLLPAMALAVVSAALPFVTLNLPPIVQQVRSWRWLITAGVALLAFALLSLQLLVGFSMKSMIQKKIDAELKSERDKAKTDEDFKILTMREGGLRGQYGLRQTSWVRTAWVLNLVAVLAALAAFWLDRRGTGRPLPRADVMW